MLRLTFLLILCAAVRGREFECDRVYYDECWNSEIDHRDHCWVCEIRNEKISDSDEVILIFLKDGNGAVPYVEAVKFSGDDIIKMPKVILKTSDSQILQMELENTKTRVLNEQFFGNSGINLTYFASVGNENLLVEADAFQNFKKLEHLDLHRNEIASIVPDAFRGLHKLVRLNLGASHLSQVLNGWFDELGNLEELSLYENQLAEIPDNSLKSLAKLKVLYLDKNEIEIITRKMFQHNEQLQTIDLANNRIKQIQSGSFAHISQLTELIFWRNKCINTDFIEKTPDEIAKGLTACYPTTESTCVIPQILNGIVVSTDDNSTQVPGDLFEVASSVKVVCNSAFTQIHDKANQTTNRCVDDNWEDQQWPTCQKLCPRKEIIDETFSASCDREGENFHCSGQLLPGTKATIRCQSAFMNPKGLVNSELTCLESGNWNQSAHKCEKIIKTVTLAPVQLGVSCSYQEISHLSIISYCELNGKDINCTDPLPPGTKATIKCHFGYKKPQRVKSDLTCEESGNWNHKAYKCDPLCGRVTSHSIPLQIGGKDTNVTEVPWHVGIYEHDIQICGGTIISERVVISAAHCFSQNTNHVHDIAVKNYKIAAGKISRGLFENETQEAQIKDVQEVEISHKYDGFNTWYGDIATIIIKGHFDYQPHIVPACVQFIENRDDWYPKNESKALVAGWGLKKDYLSSDTLQSFDIPVVDFDSCLENAPQDFEAKVVEDKICAGYLDPSGKYSKVVCQGDSGGGLLIPQTAFGKKLYYLQGVVSNAQKAKEACQISYYTLFTNVQHFKNLINKALNITKNHHQKSLPKIIT